MKDRLLEAAKAGLLELTDSFSAPGCWGDTVKELTEAIQQIEEGRKGLDENPGASEIVALWLQEHGYDGLYNEDDECGCGLGDFCPCENLANNCRAGYSRKTPEGSSVDFVIGPEKEDGEGR